MRNTYAQGFTTIYAQNIIIQQVKLHTIRRKKSNQMIVINFWQPIWNANVTKVLVNMIKNIFPLG